MFNNLINKIKEKVNNDSVVEGKLGSTIKLKRKAGDYTLQQFSNSYGVSVSYLSKIENNHMKPNVSYIGNILNKLQINEEMFSSSLIMNDWYKKLMETILQIKSSYDELIDYATQRSDYQAKFIKFALDVYFNHSKLIAKRIDQLMFNIELLKPIELSIFVLSIAKYNISINNYFQAGLILNQLNSSYLKDDLTKLWYYELAFELALYQSSFSQLEKVTEKLTKYYFSYGLFKKAEKVQKRFMSAKSYFMPPQKHPKKRVIDLARKSYQCSLVFYKKFDEFIEIKNKNPLAQLLFDDIHSNVARINKTLKVIVFSDDPLEKLLEIYFKTKYDNKGNILKLRKMFFSNSGLVQHYYGMEFLAEKLSEYYRRQSRYKECYLINKKLLDLKKKNRVYLALKLI